MERFFIENINIPTCRNSHISYVDGIKSKIVAAQIGNQLGRLPFQNGNKTYQLLYRENRRHKAVLKTM
jgi:hypothetical protein